MTSRGSSTFAYNGDGLRMAQASGGTTVADALDVNSALPQLLYDGTRYYVYGLGLLYSVNPGGYSSPTSGLTTHLRIYHTDGLGSVRALTTETGTLTNTYQTDAFRAGGTQ